MSSDKSRDLNPAPNGESSAEAISIEDSRYVAGEVAEALKEIARGEQTASMLEANLTSLESKLDAILAGLESQIPAAEAAEEQEPKQDPKQGGPKN